MNPGRDNRDYGKDFSSPDPQPLAHGTRAFEYSLGVPTPPDLGLVTWDAGGQSLPAYAGVGGEDLSESDLRIITQSSHIAVDSHSHWQYSYRRNAQLILPFLYLGPSTAAKDAEFLKREGITLLLATRNAKTALASLCSGDKIARQLGIASESIDTAGNQELIAAFPRVVKCINDHLLAVYR